MPKLKRQKNKRPLLKPLAMGLLPLVVLSVGAIAISWANLKLQQQGVSTKGVRGGVVSVFPADADGGWDGIANALGDPDVGAEGDGGEFSTGNSAAYLGGAKDAIFTQFNITREDLESRTSKEDEVGRETEPLGVEAEEDRPEDATGAGEEEVIQPGEEGAEESPEEGPGSEGQNPDDEEVEIENGSSLNSMLGTKTALAAQVLNLQQIEKNDFAGAKIFLSFAAMPADEGMGLPSGRGQSLFGKLGRLFGDKARANSGESLGLDLDTAIMLKYSVDGENWHELDFFSEEISNRSNSGYFNYDAPLISSWEELGNLQIKLEGLAGAGPKLTGFLDGIWVQVRYGREERTEGRLEIFSDKRDWRKDEHPKFKIKDPGQHASFFERTREMIASSFREGPMLDVKLRNSQGSEFNLERYRDYLVRDQGPIEIELLPGNDLPPGNYFLELTLDDEGKQQDFEGAFSWGLLAVNFNKSVYLENERVHVQLAALDGSGHTLCDADLAVEIIKPDLSNRIFRTKDGTIEKSTTCGPNNVTDVADYFFHYDTSQQGSYEVIVTNLDEDFEISDSFEVRERLSFEVERTGATRINPFRSAYRMNFNIKANEDFSGSVIETVPASFEIEPDDNFSLSTGDDAAYISWEGIEIKEGTEVSLSYVYQAPEVSPMLYLLGPLRLESAKSGIGDWLVLSDEPDFKEARSWQIAADAAKDIKVQRGTNDVARTGGTDSSFTSVSSLSSAFAVNTNNQNNTAGPSAVATDQEIDDISGTIELTATDTLTFTRQSASSTNTMRFQWEIWEYVGPAGGANEFIVRSRNTVSLSSTASATQSLDSTPTDIDKCIPFITGISSNVTSNGEDHATAVAYINDSGSLAVTRGGTTGTTIVQVVVVEFTGSNWNVGHGVSTGQTGDNGTITLNTDSDGAGGSAFNATTWSDAAIFGTTVVTNGAEGLAHQAVYYEPNSDTSMVDWAFDANHAATNDHVVHVLDNVQMAVTRFSNTGNGQGDVDTDITSAGLTDLSAASVAGSSVTTSGTGDALARGWRNYRLTSLTNAAAWCHRSGNTMQHEIQVIDFALVSSDPITTQMHYRWRDDTTDLNTAGGWLGNEDSNDIGDITKNQAYRIRIEVANTGGTAETAGRTYELQWGDRSGFSSCSQITTWTGVGNASDQFDLVGTTHIDPDGETVSSGLLANSESYTFVNGKGHDATDTTSSIGPLTNSYYTELEYSIMATDDAVTGRNYCFRLYDTTAGSALNLYVRYPRVRISSVLIGGTNIMEWGTQSNVSDDSWTTINFSNSYTSPVFVCAVQYDNNIGNESINNADTASDADSIVCRAQSVGSTSAQVRLQEPGTSDVLSETVHWQVAEAGNYDTDDIKLEAFTYSSTVTDAKNSYVGQSQTYSQTYSEPVILGQVMTYADSGWSVFWAGGSSGGNSSSLPSSSALYTGKHVAEDSDTTRNNETIGVLVIEESHGMLGNIEFEAGIQGQTVERIDDSPSDTYTFNESFSSAPAVAVVSQAGISGGDGPHPVLYGSSPLTSTTLNFTIMEDEIADEEQSGNTEAASYIAFESSGSYTINQTALDQTTYRFYDNANSVQPGTALASQNTSITGVGSGTVVRIRVALQVGINNLAASSNSFKLQYGQGSTCSAIGTWTDVGAAGSGTIWRGYDNTSVSDGATVTASLLNATTNALESYEEQNNSVNNPNGITKGTRGEWDWVVQNNGATASTGYCFRMALSDSSVIQYTRYPQLTTASAGGFSVSGTVYLDNETTPATTGNGGQCDSSTSNLSLRVNGGSATTTTCSSTDGSFTFSGVSASAGDTITIYSTDSTDKSNRVYVSDGTADTGMDLYKDTIALGDEQDGSLNILDTVDYDNDQNATDMLYDAEDTTTDTFVGESGIELHIHTGDTFAPGGDVTTTGSAGHLHLDDSATYTQGSTDHTIGGDVLIDSSATLSATDSGSFYVGGSWTNSGAFTHNDGTVTFNATTTGNTITDGDSAFYDLLFNGSGGEWLYTDGTSTAPNSTTVQSGTPTFLNAKTGTVSVTGGTLNVDWYLGTHVVDADNTSTDIDTGDNDVAILEAGDNPTVWEHNGSSWGSGAAVQYTGTNASGDNPQPNNSGAIRIREYSMTASTSCPGAGCTLYKYNEQVAWTGSYGEYDYYDDQSENYLTSCLAGSTISCSDDTTDDDVIGAGWYRSAIGTMNTPLSTVNEPPANGSWHVGMLQALSFSIDSFSRDYGVLLPGSNPTDLTNTLTATSSASHGYVVYARAEQDMTCSNNLICGTATISDWTGTNAAPTTWSGGSFGFGYSTNDHDLQGGTSNRFSGPNFAGFVETGFGDPVADRTGPSSGQQNVITYRIAPSAVQNAGPYQASIVYVIVPTY